MSIKITVALMFILGIALGVAAAYVPYVVQNLR